MDTENFSVSHEVFNTRYLSREEYNKRRQEFMDSLPLERQKQIRRWLVIGKANCWVQIACDPPFDELSFCICSSVQELSDKIFKGNYCLGQAFVLDDICFINQVDGGDEWLTIKGKTPFESITMKGFNENDEQAQARLFETVERIKNATEEQCKDLEY